MTLPKETIDKWQEDKALLEAKGGKVVNVHVHTDWIVSGYIPPAPPEPVEPTAKAQVKRKKRGK